MISYTVIRLGVDNVVKDVSLFPGEEHDFACYVADISRRMYPTDIVTVEVTFTGCWKHIKKEFKKDKTR